VSERDDLVEAITRQILAELQKDSGKDGCCADCAGSCAACCSDKVRQTVEAGASRISYQGDGGKVPSDLARYIDHTLLKPEATAADIDRYCAEARKYGFAAVCFNPVWVKRAAQNLRGSNVVVASVIGFPLGAQTTDIKVLEARRALRDGAREIDMVMNVGALKSGDQETVRQDIARVADACREARAVLKVILEPGLLSDEEKVIASKLARAARADFVKTSTGFGPGGATPFDVALMREAVGPAMGVKASGGVRTAEQAEALIAAGATRIGASAGIAIVGGEIAEKGGTPSGRY
jgi:deoxyribose-phosphate aldolase